MNRVLKVIALCVIVVLIVLLALAVIANSTFWKRKSTSPTALGGAGNVDDKISIEVDNPERQTTRHMHGIGTAMHKYALDLADKDVVGVHNLSRSGYSAAQAENTGGGTKRRIRSDKSWNEYSTWAELTKDKEANARYMKDRAKALNDLKFDWSQVLATVNPLLDEDREYIGLISPEKDGTTLRVIAMEASPLKAGEDKNPNVFASVPSELVEKMSARPAMFIFHSHPADRRASPLPSPADVSTAITMGYAGIYAANVVISRYGVILYTLGWGAYKNIHSAKAPGLAMRHMRYDVASFLLGMRSWKDWDLNDYQKAYERYQLLMVIYPSTEYTAASHLLKFRSDMSAPSDFEFLDMLRDSIESYQNLGKQSRIKDVEH